jgi:hypothetical protein
MLWLLLRRDNAAFSSLEVQQIVAQKSDVKGFDVSVLDIVAI